MSVAAPRDLQGLRRRLLAWYDARQRDLPWRRDPSLYGTWIAEMMLQQTTVATVAPAWRRFLARFPDVVALATAPEADVLAAWTGLGYYRRARHLHAAARAIVAEREGVLPRTLEGWRALPGVGAYAAGAIASIGLGLRAPALDANARRVFARWSAPADGAAVPAVADLEELAAALVDPERPGDWNQAVMELGATICRARTAHCAACPVCSDCRAAATADPAAIGRPPARPAVRRVVASSLVVLAGEGVLLLPSTRVVTTHATGLGPPVREDLGGLHTGLLAPPQTPWYDAGAPDARDALRDAWRLWLARQQLDTDRLVHLGGFSHAITHHRLRVEVFRLPLGEPPARRLAATLAVAWPWPALRAGSGGDQALPLSTPAKRALALAAPASK